MVPCRQAGQQDDSQGQKQHWAGQQLGHTPRDLWHNTSSGELDVGRGRQCNQGVRVSTSSAYLSVCEGVNAAGSGELAESAAGSLQVGAVQVHT